MSEGAKERRRGGWGENERMREGEREEGDVVGPGNGALVSTGEMGIQFGRACDRRRREGEKERMREGEWREA